MREKELRLALICYGGVSLAVYMHGITKEVWHLVRASKGFHTRLRPGPGSEAVYHDLLEHLCSECALDLRVMVDIVAGASAGGINAIFLADAISRGRSLEPLTELWLANADVDALIDPEVSRLSRFAKLAAVPLAWAVGRRGEAEEGVDDAHRNEVRAKLASFVRARWFDPPFGGAAFTGLLLDAFAAMGEQETGEPLLPAYQPLDLFVTVTDFHGHPERLSVHSPEEVVEMEHRITLSFRDAGGPQRSIADEAELAFAARATASFPGAFPPFTVAELDKVLEERGQAWPGRADFLRRALPRYAAIGEPEQAVLIDGGVLANAPFGPAIRALRDRPARREIDRRFVYIDPNPGAGIVRTGKSGEPQIPGFFTTIFGAISNIPREQPIRDNLEAIEQRSARVRQLRRVIDSLRPEVEAAIERAFGTALFLLGPTEARLANWRTRAQVLAARQAGFAYAAYGQLKIATLVEEVVAQIVAFAGGDANDRQRVRRAIWKTLNARRLTTQDAVTARGARPDVVLFLRRFDLGFRTRRLRFVARDLAAARERMEAPPQVAEEAAQTFYEMIDRYRARLAPEAPDAEARAAFAAAEAEPEAALEALARTLDLERLAAETDQCLISALTALPKGDRRRLILNYLGFPFYDIATLPLLHGEGLDEFDPVKVDRISPDDARAIRGGGAEATLKGTQFQSFGAFFSRAYRENDYLWGRLHGADRLIDIAVSALPPGKHLEAGEIAGLKRRAFRAIITQERERLGCVQPLLDTLAKELG